MSIICSHIDDEGKNCKNEAKSSFPQEAKDYFDEWLQRHACLKNYCSLHLQCNHHDRHGTRCTNLCRIMLKSNRIDEEGDMLRCARCNDCYCEVHYEETFLIYGFTRTTQTCTHCRIEAKIRNRFFWEFLTKSHPLDT